MKIVLGSASKRRQRILHEMGYEFDVMTADLDEKSIRHHDPKQLTLILAHAKADALLPRLTQDVLLITSDLVTVFEGKILEKPETKEEAIETLKSYGDRPIETVCAVVVTNTKTRERG